MFVVESLCPLQGCSTGCSAVCTCPPAVDAKHGLAVLPVLLESGVSMALVDIFASSESSVMVPFLGLSPGFGCGERRGFWAACLGCETVPFAVVAGCVQAAQPLCRVDC